MVQTAQTAQLNIADLTPLQRIYMWYIIDEDFEIIDLDEAVKIATLLRCCIISGVTIENLLETATSITPLLELSLPKVPDHLQIINNDIVVITDMRNKIMADVENGLWVDQN